MTRKNGTKKVDGWRWLLPGLLAAALAAGCGGGGGGDDDSEPVADDDPPLTDTAFPDIAARTVFVNPNDSFLYELGLQDGSQLRYLGQRDESGLPTALTDIAFTDAQGEVFNVSLNNLGLPTRIADEQGNVLILEFLDMAGQPVGALPANANLLVTEGNLRTAEGKARLQDTSLLPLEDGNTTTVPTIRARLLRPADDGSGRLVEVTDYITLDEPVQFARDSSLVQNRASSPEGNIVVEVEKCDIPIDPAGSVVVDFQRRNSSLSGRYPAWPAGQGQTGKFIARLPTRPSSSDLLQTADAICTAAADSLDKVCKVFNPVASSPGVANALQNPGVQAAFCAQLTQAVALSPLAPKAPLVGSLCVGGLVATTAACNSIGISGANPDAPNVLNAMCGVFDSAERGLQALDSAEGLDVARLQAIVDFRGGDGIASPGTTPGGIAASPPEEADASGPFPRLLVNDLSPSVDRIRLAPGQPEAGEPYNAEADLSCVQGADIAIEAQRDGAVIAGDFRGSSSLDRTSIGLQVPAAPSAGAQDIIRVSANNPALAQSTLKTLAVSIPPVETPPPQPPGPGAFDFDSVSEARFRTQLIYDGEVFNRETVTRTNDRRELTFSGSANESIVQGGFRACGVINATAAAFSFRREFFSGANNALRDRTQIAGALDASDCLTLVDGSIVIDIEDTAMDATSLAYELRLRDLQGTIVNAGLVRYRASGQAACDAVVPGEVDLYDPSDNGSLEFSADSIDCDANSVIEVELLIR
tara:strand:- start:9801 stop:12074 length:2274 start_codon:yes stop_codon:yes gene_type:complete